MIPNTQRRKKKNRFKDPCSEAGATALDALHKAKHILHSFFEEWECSYRGLDTG